MTQTATLSHSTPPLPEPPQAEAWQIWIRRLAPFIGLIVVFTFFSIMRWQRFDTRGNMETIARGTAIVGTAAMGMTLIIISAGIDLSVGSAVALVSIVIARCMSDFHCGPIVSALGGIAAGALLGLLIGGLITGLRLVPFIVTLGTWTAFRGVAIGLSADQGNPIYPDPTWLNNLMRLLPPDQHWMLVAPGVWIMLVLALLVAGLLRYTQLGRHIFAVGSNEQTARLCGVKVNRTKLLVYTIAGACVGVAGVLQFSSLGGGDPTVAVGLELDVIAAVVIGGGSLSGGEGSVLGTLIGALFMRVVANGCAEMGFDNWEQMIVTGVIIILAVALDRLRHARSS
jgi:ribose/xylose/arabinose/galactoside ABC-type transport system permease subunit